MKTTSYTKLNQLPLSEQTLVLTANQRLALRLIEAYDDAHYQNGHTSWPSAAIFSLSNWLQLQSTQFISKQILKPHQENYLWEQIIKLSCDDSELINPAETATQVMQAYQTLKLWNIELSTLAAYENHEVILFYQWSLQFEALCQQRDLIIAANCCHQLMLQHNLKRSLQFTEILLLGFDDLPPVMRSFFEWLNQTIPVNFIHIQKPAQSIQTISLHDQKNEIEAMARWSKICLDQKPNAKIGCICPQLEKLRHTLYIEFITTLNPEALLPNGQEKIKLFNISAGQMFGLYPIIDSALSCLHWLGGKIDMTNFGYKIQSPYLHQHRLEQDIAAELDCRLRELDDIVVPISVIFQTSLSTSIDDEISSRNLIARFHDLHRYAQSLPDRATLASWKSYFLKTLSLIGWPGYRTLNSDDYQLVVRLYNLLDEFTDYASVCESLINLDEALYLLHKLITNTIFQVEGSHAPIQILGTLEASGNNFDFMWVMGMDDENWPPAPKPNPFIPYELQKQHHMPHATAERELIYTQQTMQRLLNSADHIIFSHAHFEGDKEKSPSHLISHYPALELEQPIPESHHQITLETLSDITAPSITFDEIISGGTWTIKQQSECPFKAFAHVQ